MTIILIGSDKHRMICVWKRIIIGLTDWLQERNSASCIGVRPHPRMREGRGRKGTAALAINNFSPFFSSFHLPPPPLLLQLLSPSPDPTRSKGCVHKKWLITGTSRNYEAQSTQNGQTSWKRGGKEERWESKRRRWRSKMKSRRRLEEGLQRISNTCESLLLSHVRQTPYWNKRQWAMVSQTAGNRIVYDYTERNLKV